ncbi:TRAP transporter small permease [bacterium LRH843]|nr:TRAP transporter small permease [bacterium LRH843]
MKVLKWLDDNFEVVFLVVLSSIMVAVIFLQVFMRYVMHNSLAWSEELARYCFIWLIYFGISYGVKKQRHISVDAALLLFKDKGKLIMTMISNLLFLAFAIFVIVYGFDMSQKLLAWGQKSPANHIPMGLVYLAAPVGMTLTAIRLIQNLIAQIKTLQGKGNFKVMNELDHINED